MRDEARTRPVGRLTKRQDFVAAASGRRFHSGRMTVQGRLRDDADGLRFGLTVTKKVGHATERNRIKRRLRQAVKQAALRLSPALASVSADIVVIARRDALAADYHNLIDDIGRALHVVTKPKSGPAGGSGRQSTPDRHAPSSLSSND
jgi:ribonuclease P protein component